MNTLLSDASALNVRPFELLIECGMRAQRAADTLLVAFTMPGHLEEQAARLTEIERDVQIATGSLYATLTGRTRIHFERGDYLLIGTQLEVSIGSFGRVARWAVACQLDGFGRATCEQVRALCGIVRVVRDMLQWIGNARRVLEFSEFVELFADRFRDTHIRALAKVFDVRSDPIACIAQQGLYQRLNVALRSTLACAESIDRVSLEHG